MHIDVQLGEAEALIGAGRVEDAIALLDRVCSRKKQDSRALHMFGVAKAMRGETERAEELLRQARALKPSAGDILTDLGSVLILRGNDVEAADVLAKARRRAPHSPLAQFYHGVALTNLKRFDEALVIFEELVAHFPENMAYAQNRATVLIKLLRFEEAEAAVDKVLRKQPTMPEALLVKSMAALNLARYDEALAPLDRIVATDPNHQEATHNRGEIRLLTGQLEHGWRDYEARWTQIGAKPRVENVPEWNGEPLNGRSLLVIHEQGLGDILQFCRFAKVLSEQGAAVTIVVPARLKRLLATLSADFAVLSELPRSQHFDFQIPLLSLPLQLRITLDNIPAWPSYLAAEPERVRQWQSRLGSADGLKIGIAWQNSKTALDHGRGIPLRTFNVLSERRAVRLISLQANVNGEAEQLSTLPDGMHVETLDDLDRGPDAFIDTAAVMANLDLVVTCDTAVNHLAGALGKPSWVALKKVPNWRWCLDRTDSPWYPSMRLYRQDTADDWDGVFARMARDLEGFADHPSLARVD